MKKIKAFIKDILEIVITSAVIVFILFNFVLYSADVNGSSMYPTLHPNDRGFSFVIKKTLGIKRFDICVINSEKSDHMLVKRVIGLPNETIEYRDNKLYVDGEYIEEDFLSLAYTDDFEVTLKDDEYYCLGDNRGVSKDSRYYGPFNKKEIKSTGFFIFYPFDRIGA